jgi:tetratricopeptide (TPR) repeat protein
MGSDEDEVYRLLNALEARIKQCGESGDASLVLDPRAADWAAKLRKALSTLDGSQRVRPAAVISVLAYFHWFRYQALPEGQNQRDLRSALTCFRALADQVPGPVVPDDLRRILAPTNPPPANETERLMAEGARAYLEFQESGDPALLGVAVALTRDALTAASSGDSNLSSCLMNLASFLSIRFEMKGAGADLDAAIDAGRRGLAMTPARNPNRPFMLSNLGNSLSMRYERDQDIEDLNAAIDITQQALAAAPAGPSSVAALNNLGLSLTRRYERTGNIDDLNAGIAAQQAAVAAAPADG